MPRISGPGLAHPVSLGSNVPPQRAVAASLQLGFLQDMSITNEFHSVSGLEAGSLEVGQVFPNKKSAYQAIDNYAIALHAIIE